MSSALFGFGQNFKKGTAFLESFQKIIICESAGIFVAQQRHKNPGFFFFKKGADSQHPFLSRSPFSGGTAFFSAPSGRMFQRVKVPNPPDSGKDIAKSKGVPGNWESEGSWRQITGLTNRNHEG